MLDIGDSIVDLDAEAPQPHVDTRRAMDDFMISALFDVRVRRTRRAFDVFSPLPQSLVFQRSR